MLNKKILIILVILISLFTLTTVCAQDNATCDNDVITCDNETLLTSSSKNFTDLNKLINDNNDANVYLNDDFTYDDTSDSDFKDGIVIDRPLNIFGNGVQIDGSGKARIFNIQCDNVFINGVTFVNGNAQNGGAIIGNSYGVIGCTFTGNHADNSGGAIVNGSAENCIFKSNTASNGGAIYKGSAVNCEFENNDASYGGAIYDTYAKDSRFTNNVAHIRSGAMEGNVADNCTFIGNYAVNDGGAVYMAYVIDSEFRDNHANYGGAVFGNDNSVVNSKFINNYANEMGGALYNIYAVDCEFRRNNAHEGGAMYGGSARNCTFVSNYATDTSGAIKGYSEDCVFIDNSAYRAGAVEGDSKNCRFEENHAVMGGAIYAGSAEGCTFIKNYADEGGAIYAGSARFCEFSENNAETGGAMYSGTAVNSNFTKNVAEIAGGAFYRTAATNCNLKDNLPRYKLEVSDFEPLYGFTGQIKIKLCDSKNNYLNNVKTIVKVFDSNNDVAFVTSCYSGETCFLNLDLGEFTYVVSVEGDNEYNVDPVSQYINVKKFTSIYVVSVTATYDINNPLIVNLHDIDGAALKNTQVKITVNGATKTYTTNVYGQVLLSTVGLTPKGYNVLINYDGSSKYHSTSASARITVNKATPFIIVSNMKYYASEKVKKFYMILKDNRYRPMKNVKVTLKVKGKTFTAKTNKNGRATFKIKKVNKKGKLKATVKYSGNSYYNSLSKSAKITIKK